MNGPLVLRFGPYVAVLLAGALFALRLVRLRVVPPRGDDAVFARSGSRGGAWRSLGGGVVGPAAGLALVLLIGAHLVAVLAPDDLRRVLGMQGGLYLIEGLGFLLGLVALLGTLAGVGRHLLVAEPPLAAELGDGVFLSSLLLTVGCGLAVAARHRWASLWSLGTVIPYVRSVARGVPAPALVSGTPFAAQLHLVASLAALAALPISRLGGALAELVLRAAALVGASVDAAARLAVRVARPQRLAAWLWPEEDLVDLARQQRRATAVDRRLTGGRRTVKKPPVLSPLPLASVPTDLVDVDADTDRRSLNVEGGN